MWILLFMGFHNGALIMNYAGEYATQYQCETMAKKLDSAALVYDTGREGSLPYLCVVKPPESDEGK